MTQTERRRRWELPLLTLGQKLEAAVEYDAFQRKMAITRNVLRLSTFISIRVICAASETLSILFFRHLIFCLEVVEGQRT